MATKYTKVAGYLRRYDGDDQNTLHRISVSKSMTEGGYNNIVVAVGSSNISLMPTGLTKVTSFFLETDSKINIEISGNINASFDILANGIVYMNASLDGVTVSNATGGTANIIYDLTG